MRPLARVHERARKGELAGHTVQTSSAILRGKQQRVGERAARLQIRAFRGAAIRTHLHVACVWHGKGQCMF